MSEKIDLTPPELREIANNVSNKLIPQKSKTLYEKEYEKLMKWSEENSVIRISENVLLAYFEHLSRTYKSSTLWKTYSMLRSMLNVQRRIDISKFIRLQCLLKKFSKEYKPKKSKVLDFEQIDKFLKNVSNNTYLDMKVVLIMGYAGACRRVELCNMKVQDIEFKDDCTLVTIPNTKTYSPRQFIISDPFWLTLLREYYKLRPSHTDHDRFFINFKAGKCTVQPIGINKIGGMPTRVANFLNLPDPELYSGHCFRRSSASHLANSGEDLMALKRHGGWKSSAVAEGYVDASLSKKFDISKTLSTQLNKNAPEFNMPSTSTAISNISKFTIGTQEINISPQHPMHDNQPSTSSACFNQPLSMNETHHNVPLISTLNTGSNCNITVKIFNNCTISKIE